jgi:NADH:ubiquinone oxidoreductase subunit 3 (subunit A)
MTRRILVELALFLIPFAVFFFYRLASREMRVADRWPLTMLVIVGGVLAVGVFVLEPLLSPSDKGKCYVAARYENGVTIPAQSMDCAEVKAPGKGESTPARNEPAPVAPRDATTSTPLLPAPPPAAVPAPAKPPTEIPAQRPPTG